MSTGFPTLRAATSKRIAKAACGIAVLSILLAGAALVSRGQWGDQGDGSYANPVLPGDFSDLDAIRVGTNFYAISSTFQYSPGIVLLHSKNLVNWQIIGHVIPDITRIAADLNWDKMDRAGRGVWAGAIRFSRGQVLGLLRHTRRGYFPEHCRGTGRTVDPRETSARRSWMGRPVSLLG
jgi:hypothetical protein